MADNLTPFIFRLSRNLGVSIAWNPHNLSRAVHDFLYLYYGTSFMSSFMGQEFLGDSLITGRLVNPCCRLIVFSVHMIRCCIIC
jgi:hypothetical protein